MSIKEERLEENEMLMHYRIISFSKFFAFVSFIILFVFFTFAGLSFLSEVTKMMIP